MQLGLGAAGPQQDAVAHDANGAGAAGAQQHAHQQEVLADAAPWQHVHAAAHQLVVVAGGPQQHNNGAGAHLQHNHQHVGALAGAQQQQQQQQQQQDDDEMDAEDVCAICRDPLVNEPACQTRCRHLYHTRCLQQWSCQSEECPMCRGDIEPVTFVQFVVNI